jgi:alpha-2-macroglobulin
LGGDLVLVDLTLVTPAARKFVVIDDALPAGLEAVDPKLLTSADWLRTSGIDEAADSGAATDDEASSYAVTSARSEVRDDRVLFFIDELPAGLAHYRYLARATTLGRFVLPPTRVEEMYTPEVFGRTGAAELRVE